MRVKQMELILMLSQCYIRSMCVCRFYGRFWSSYQPGLIIIREPWKKTNYYLCVIKRMLLHCPIGCSYLISHREAVAIMLVMVLISCYTHIGQQVEMFLIRWPKLSRRSPPRLLDCTSLMRPRVLGSLAGQVVRQSAYVEHSCKRFLYICLQLWLKMGPRGFGAGLGRGASQTGAQTTWWNQLF